MSANSSLNSGKGRRWFNGIIALVGFVLVGVAFLPQLVSRDRTELPPTETLRAAGAYPLPRSVALPRNSAEPVTTSSLDSRVSPYFDCMISASETVEIGSSILATIEEITVERSDYVEAGQVVAILESRVEEAAVRIARARAERRVELESTRVSLQLGKKRRSRAFELYEGKSLSLDLFDEVDTETTLAELGVREAEENHRLAILQLEQAEAALDRRTIRSPISGFVVERLMTPGEVVDDETVVTIAQVDPLRVDVILPTLLFGSVSPGDEMEILPEAPLDQPHITKVSIVDRVLDGASGTFGVRLLLPNPDHQLPGGLRCQARLLKDDRATGS